MRLILRSWKLRPLAHAIATAGAILYALASVGFSLALGMVADKAVLPALDEGSVSERTLWSALSVLALVGSLRALGAMSRRWFQSLAEFGTQRTWREQLVAQYVNLPLAYHRRVPAGQLLAHADTDLERSTRMLKPLAFAVGAIALAIASFVALLTIHVLFALVAAVLFPTLSRLNRIYTNRVALPAQRERVENGELSSITHESFDGALVVKTLGREAAEVARLSQAAHRLRATRVEVGRLRAYFDPTLEALPNLGIIALVAIGSWLVQTGGATVGELISAVSLLTILSVPVRIVGFLLEEMPGAVAALDRVDGVLLEQPAAESSRSISLTKGPHEVTLDHVDFAYEDNVAVLNGVSFSVPAGGSVAIVGATGSGKSTIVSLLAGLVEPTGGSVRIDGTPVSDIDRTERTNRIATVFQETFLFASTIRENVTLGLVASDDEVERALRMAQAWEFVSALESGIDTVVGERGVTLSGGQRQRVALARALLRGPSVVLLDDATSALDPAVERDVLSILRHDLHATLVLVAYRLATIELADTVVYLVDGELVAIGRHRELMGRSDYAALVRAYEDAPV